MLFDAIEARFDPPPGIREIIALQRARAAMGHRRAGKAGSKLGRGQRQQRQPGRQQPQFLYRRGSGVLNLVLSPEFTPHRDRFNQITLDGAVSGLGNGWQGYAQLQSRRRYDTQRRYDSESALLGAERPGGWAVGRTAGRQRWPHPPGRRKLSTLRHHQRLAGPPLALPTGWQLGWLNSFSHGVSVTLAF